MRIVWNDTAKTSSTRSSQPRRKEKKSYFFISKAVVNF